MTKIKYHGDNFKINQDSIHSNVNSPDWSL